jgi:hypothetical protein
LLENPDNQTTKEEPIAVPVNPVAIDLEEVDSTQKPGSLVALREGMISRNAEQQRRRERGYVLNVAVGERVLRSGESAFEQAAVTQKERLACPYDHSLVDVDDSFG